MAVDDLLSTSVYERSGRYELCTEAASSSVFTASVGSLLTLIWKRNSSQRLSPPSVQEG